MRNEKHKALIAKVANRKVKSKDFPKGLLVFQQVEGLHKAQEGKLTANWEDPFKAKQNLKNGAYKLKTIKGKAIPHTWNGTCLKAYHIQV